MSSNENIEGKVIVITGASSGIGEATARLLAGRGARVVLGARRADRLERLAADIQRAGGIARIRATDVTRRADVAALVEAAQKDFGRVDVLISNAGIMPLAPLDALKVDEWDQMIDVNVRGVLHGIAAALPVFRAQGAGQFIHLSSVAGHAVMPTAAVYCATKFAVGAISEGLRQEAGAAIRVTVISPGVVESELAHTITHAETAKAIDDFRKTIIPADAIARAIAFAIAQPADVDINEIIVRPTAQAF
jgi:NADP-dependent 3-hydroxy acid dehydrogenase YdfG